MDKGVLNQKQKGHFGGFAKKDICGDPISISPFSMTRITSYGAKDKIVKCIL